MQDIFELGKYVIYEWGKTKMQIVIKFANAKTQAIIDLKYVEMQATFR